MSCSIDSLDPMSSFLLIKSSTFRSKYDGAGNSVVAGSDEESPLSSPLQDDPEEGDDDDEVEKGEEDPDPDE